MREEELVETLRCAIAINYPAFEILVIDQTKLHSNETLSFLKEINTKIRIINPSFASLTKARNLGIRESKGDIFVFIDDDVAFEPSFLTNHIQRHQLGADIVQGRIIEDDKREFANKPSWLHRNITYRGSDTCETSGPTNIVTGCNFSVSRKVVETIGGFDTHFQGVAVREDSDFGYRAYRAGFCLWFEPSALVYHKRAHRGGVEAHHKVPFLDYWYFFCESYFSRKHFSKWSVWWYRWRVLERSLKSIWKLFRSAERDAIQKLNSIDEEK